MIGRAYFTTINPVIDKKAPFKFNGKIQQVHVKSIAAKEPISRKHI